MQIQIVAVNFVKSWAVSIQIQGAQIVDAIGDDA